jgi:AcrR family transcriptional regulator
MSGSTKDKILESSVKLFNEAGLANVRLQQIADETGISVGNLAYHFRNKEAIVLCLYEKLFEEFSRILSQYLIYPDLHDFDNQLGLFYRFFDKYKFYLFDLFEVNRNFPEVNEEWQVFTHKLLLQICKRFEYQHNRGILQPAPESDAYEQLSQAVWLTITFWIPQQNLRGKFLVEEYYKQAVWHHLLPYFTPKGQQEYERLIVPVLKLS